MMSDVSDVGDKNHKCGKTDEFHIVSLLEVFNQQEWCNIYVPHISSWPTFSFSVFSGEGPRSRRFGRTAAMRLIVQPYDEDEDDDYFLSYS
jgi:hypothetical protein